MKNRLELKILLLIIVVLIEQNREKSMLFGQTIMVGIRNVMLSGKAGYASMFVNDACDSFTFGMLRVYDQEANEVFQEEGKGIIKSSGDPNVKQAIETRQEVEIMSVGEGVGLTRLDPVQVKGKEWPIEVFEVRPNA